MLIYTYNAFEQSLKPLAHAEFAICLFSTKENYLFLYSVKLKILESTSYPCSGS